MAPAVRIRHLPPEKLQATCDAYDIMIEKLMKWSDNRPQPKGLSEEDVIAISEYFKSNFNYSLPEGYTEFLEKMNGFSFDGYTIFCCLNDDVKENFPRRETSDLLYNNTNFRENTGITNYILLGKSNISYIAYDLSTDKYVLMTDGDMRCLKEFDDFGSMIEGFMGL
ncbi:MAG: YrhA family protein [Candidatus Nomurabacteria bacterium]|nr:YrhA family protein [Candidatus Nomurabacteria bacterium]